MLKIYTKYWRFMKIQAESQNICASCKFRRNLKILALHENSGGISKYWRFMEIQADIQNLGGIVKFMHHIIYTGTKADVEISAPDEKLCACQKIRRPSKS